MALEVFKQAQAERNFFMAFAGMAWIVVLIGFYPSVAERMRGEADYPAPLILELHVAAASAWLILLSGQVALIRTRRIPLHRRIGMTLAALIPVIVITGIGAEVYSQRFFSPRYPENLRFFIAPLLEMLGFAIAALLAWKKRHEPGAHKRLIVVATAILLVAPFARWWGEPLYQLVGDGFAGMVVHNFAGPDLLVALAAGFDRWKFGKVHRVYLVSLFALLVGEVMASAIYHSAAWPGVVRLLIGI